MIARKTLHPPSSSIIKLFNSFFGRLPRLGISSSFTSKAAHALDPAFNSDRDNEEYADIDWDGLGFNPIPTDYMYMMKCRKGEGFSSGELSRYGNIELSPSAGVLNYGQVPPHGKGSLYIRPLLIGSGSVLGMTPSPEYTLLVYAMPVGTYFKVGFAPISLLVEDEIARAALGGTGDVKSITNYAPVLKAQTNAKAKGCTEVLYLDSTNKKYLEEASSSNVFIVKGNTILTPETNGTILSGITRGSIISIARDYGYQVEERLISIDELVDADEVFCTGTAVVIAPVGSVTYHDQRYEYKTNGERVFQKLYKSLTDIQMGLAEDKKGWTVRIE